jgi:hypothetical protein
MKSKCNTCFTVVWGNKLGLTFCNLFVAAFLGSFRLRHFNLTAARSNQGTILPPERWNNNQLGGNCSRLAMLVELNPIFSFGCEIICFVVWFFGRCRGSNPLQ